MFFGFNKGIRVIPEIYYTSDKELESDFLFQYSNNLQVRIFYKFEYFTRFVVFCN